MKRRVTAVLVLLVVAGASVCTSYGAGGSIPLTPSQMALVVGTGGCGVAAGFMAGAGIASRIAMLVPGGQTAGVVLGISAGLAGLGIVLFCM